jgi:putative membrane protein
VFSINSFSLLAEVIDVGGVPSVWRHLPAVIVYSMVGVLVLGGCFWIMKTLMPFSLRKEIEEDQNTALAIIIGSVIIGMSIIIAAAIL